ncbi:transcriptional regulator [Kitasatospora sp. Root107]|uniref:winged helix-turn-helix domain-containing protein n=1 Tax=Kitasatospora sp. Root107 TaxID=1736424 RepID=UPI000ADA1279|nr:transcriptional regulator [Kitasatospora sp. Root107]
MGVPAVNDEHRAAAEQLLARTDTLRTRARARTGGAWAVLLGFGLLALAAVPIARYAFNFGADGRHVSVYPYFAYAELTELCVTHQWGTPCSTQEFDGSVVKFVFWGVWFALLPLAWGAAARWYRLRGESRGIVPRRTVWLLTVGGATVVVLALSPQQRALRTVHCSPRTSGRARRPVCCPGHLSRSPAGSTARRSRHCCWRWCCWPPRSPSGRPTDGSPGTPHRVRSAHDHRGRRPAARGRAASDQHPADRVDFGFLKAQLAVTDGNLSRHVKVLEDSGLVSVEKGYAGRRPRTWVILTPQGAEALERELRALRELVHRLDNSPPRPAAPDS